MRTFKAHLHEKLQDGEFKDLFEEEKELLRIGLRITEARTESGLSQKDLARRANITQQQVSRIENGINCNLATLLRVCRALNLACVVNHA